MFSRSRAAKTADQRAIVTAALALLSQVALVQASIAQPVGTGPFPNVRIAARARGADIPRALGPQMPMVAAFYGMSAADLTRRAQADHGMFAETDGVLGYVCEGLVAAAPAGKAPPVEQAAYPLSSTFLLHSLATAYRTVYLDFDGHVTSGTNWNKNYTRGANIVTPAFDLDGNPGSFSDAEKSAIQQIYMRVAEDFAAFDVDVTTQDPGIESLRKTAPTDLYYGIRVCIGGSSSNWYGTSTGGVSYVGSFNWNSDTPCFVFPAQLASGNSIYVAEACSHETGHTLGLSHDGTTTGVEYYQGQGDWAPIMGASYYRPITQWSKGEYANANNKQDDLAVMVNYGAPVRYSDHGDTPDFADAMEPGPSFGAGGSIESTSDVDVFEFQSGPGTAYIQVAVASPSPNLDVLAKVLDQNRNVIASANPSSMQLSMTASLHRGTYYLSIEGVGAGDPLTTGYSDYGSLGIYSMTAIVPDPDDTAPPDAVASADPTQGTAPLIVQFSSAGSFDSNGTLVAFDWDFGDGSPHSSDPNPSHTFTSVGTFACGLTVTDNSGLADFDTVRVVVQGPPTGAPSNLAGAPSCDPSDLSPAIALGWSDNSINEDGFEIEQSTDGVSFSSVGPQVAGTSYLVGGLPAYTQMWFRVRAVNSLGVSAWSNLAIATTKGMPTAVPVLSAVAASSSLINLSWSNVADESSYELQRSPDGVSSWVTIAQPAANVTSFSNSGLPSLAQYFYRIRALGPCSYGTAYSAVAQAMTSGTLVAPTSPVATKQSWTRVNMTWVDKSNNEWGFRIQRSNVSSFTPAVEFSVGANVAKFTDTTVVAKTTYYYRVRAFAGPVNSAWTKAVSLTMPADSTTLIPQVPGKPVLTALGGPRNLVKWTDLSAWENGFEIQRSTSSSFSPLTSVLVGKNVTSYTDSIGLSAGVKYYYRVRSFNAAGYSAFSSAVSVVASTVSASEPVMTDPKIFPAAATGTDAAPARVFLRNAAPNPFTDRSTIAFDLPAAASVDLAIFDISGRRIATLASGQWEAGRHVTQWSGRDHAGRLQAPGVFFARLAVGRTVMTRALALTR